MLSQIFRVKNSNPFIGFIYFLDFGGNQKYILNKNIGVLLNRIG